MYKKLLNTGFLNKPLTFLFVLISTIVGLPFFAGQAAEVNSNRNIARAISIGLLPGGNPQEIEKQSYVLAEKLQAKLNHPVKIIISKNYKGLVEAMQSKKVDFALFSSLTYVVAEKQIAMKVLLKKTWYGPYYYSTLLVNKESKIKSLKDIKNKSILFVDEQSTSGYLYPKVYLKKNKIEDKDFKSIAFSGNHAASIKALENHQVDIVAVFSNDEKGKDGAWTRFSKKDPKSFRLLWMSEPIPNDPIVVRQDFYDENPKLTHEIMYNLIEIQSESSKQVSEILGTGDLMPATTKQYDPVREMYGTFEKNIKL